MSNRARYWGSSWWRLLAGGFEQRVFVVALHAGAGIEVGFTVVIFPDFVVGGLGGGPFEDDFLDDRAVFFGIDFVVAVFPTGIEPVGQDDEHVINHGQTS